MTAEVVATFTQADNTHGLSGRSVVALPPSTSDPSADRMRVFVNGVETPRAYDPETEA